jgi:hypothetical protein
MCSFAKSRQNLTTGCVRRSQPPSSGGVGTMMMMTGNETTLQNSGKLQGSRCERTSTGCTVRWACEATPSRWIHRSIDRSRARETDGPNFFVGEWNSWTVVGGGDETAPTAAGSHGPPSTRCRGRFTVVSRKDPKIRRRTRHVQCC